MDQFRIRALQGLLNDAELSMDQRRAAETVLRKKLDILVNGAIKHNNRDLLEVFAPLRDNWQETSSECTPC